MGTENRRKGLGIQIRAALDGPIRVRERLAHPTDQSREDTASSPLRADMNPRT